MALPTIVTHYQHQLELPLRQVASLLKLPPFVVLRLMYRLQAVVPAKKQLFPHTATKTTEPEQLFFSQQDIDLLEQTVSAIRNGIAFSVVLEILKTEGCLALATLSTGSKNPNGVHQANLKRLPAYTGKLPPFTSRQKASPIAVKKVGSPLPPAFPVLKKQSIPPAQWFGLQKTD